MERLCQHGTVRGCRNMAQGGGEEWIGNQSFREWDRAGQSSLFFCTKAHELSVPEPSSLMEDEQASPSPQSGGLLREGSPPKSG
eukprot:1159041-Pelagomonas_calceolata.AAC.3